MISRRAGRGQDGQLYQMPTGARGQELELIPESRSGIFPDHTQLEGKAGVQHGQGMPGSMAK
jgi:hypothetical protein